MRPRPDALLRHQLEPPRRSDCYLRRERLLVALDDLVEGAPVTLLSAPAGAGKSSLLAGWAAESRRTVAWLSLDEGDRDPARFWMAIAATLQAPVLGATQPASPLLVDGGAAAERVLPLVECIEARRGPPVVVVIDGLELVEDVQAVATLLLTFLHHLPARHRVVLASRRRPGPLLERMRARGRLREIHFSELRFSPDEAAELLCRLAPSMPPEQVAAATERADGWAAGLRMAALAFRSARAVDAEAAAGSAGALINAYMMREVFATEDPALVEVLTDISVIERVGAGLARALTRREDVDERLRRAEARGLFVAARTDGRFELHAAARGALMSELAACSASRLARQHRRAARWFEDAGDVPAALDQWLRAQQPGEALRLLAETHYELYRTGDDASIIRTLAAIPANVAHADLESMVRFAWSHVLVDRGQFLELVDQTSWWAARQPTDATASARVGALRAIAATMTGSVEEGAELLRRVPTTADDALTRSLCRFGGNVLGRALALGERWDDGEDARPRIVFEGTRAVGLALAGRALDAVRVAGSLRPLTPGAGTAIAGAEAALAEALAWRELGDRERAESALRLLAERPTETMVYCRILAAVELVHLQRDAGDLEAVRWALQRAEALLEAESFGVDGWERLGRIGTVVALDRGDGVAARRWSAMVNDDVWRAIGAARIDLAEGNPQRALMMLEGVRPRTVRQEVVVGLLRARAADDDSQALRHVSAAVARAIPAGMVQTLAAEDPAIAPLVERAASGISSEWLTQFRKAVLRSPAVPCARRIELVEALTAREHDILRFLPSRLTVREIAGELYLSVNTLKFHLKAIYRKLGVSSRAEAAAVARRLALA